MPTAHLTVQVALFKRGSPTSGHGSAAELTTPSPSAGIMHCANAAGAAASSTAAMSPTGWSIDNDGGRRDERRSSLVARLLVVETCAQADAGSISEVIKYMG